MARSRVFAVWLEAAEIDWIEPLCREGLMPNFQRLRAEGTFAPLEGSKHTFAESAHPMLMTGCRPEKTGGWSILPFDPQRYQFGQLEAFSYHRFPPFFALDSKYRTLVFDISETPIFDELPATQIAGWGSHVPLGPRASKPESLVHQIVERFGDHPGGLDRDVADPYSDDSLEQLHQNILAGLQMREAATIALIREQPWDLFFTGFSEVHSSGHWLEVPAGNELGSQSYWKQDYLRELYTKFDASLGRVLSALPLQTQTVLFSIHGMRPNHDDPANNLLLPELLFRYSFDRPGLDFSKPPPTTAELQHHGWAGAVWRAYQVRRRWMHKIKRKYPAWMALGIERLFGLPPEPFPPSAIKHLSYHAASWYQPYWQQMKAYAIPTFSDTYIRINLQERDGRGIIAPEAYERTCDEICDLLNALHLPESDERAVKQIYRTRSSGYEADPGLPVADLIVQWNPNFRGQMESPRYGKLGPVPVLRPGAHTNHGFLLAHGSQIPRGVQLPPGSPVDISATVLKLLGAPIPSHLDGRPLIPQEQPLRKAA